MKKRIISMLLAVVMTLFLVACSTSETKDTATIEAEKADSNSAELSYVGMIFPEMNNEWWVSIADQIKAPLEAKGIKVEVESSGDDYAKQQELVENFLTKNVDGLILFPIGASDIGATLEKAQEQGVHVVVMANEVDRGYDVMFVNDYYRASVAAAQAAADWIDKTFPDAADGSIEVALITTSLSEQALEATKGLRQIEQLTKKATIVDEQSVSFTDSATKIRDTADVIMTQHPEVHCILVFANDFAPSVDEMILHSSVDASKFAVFGNQMTADMASRIQKSANNESVVRGMSESAMQYDQIPLALLGEDVGADENGIVSPKVIMYTIDNVDQWIAANTN